MTNVATACSVSLQVHVGTTCSSIGMARIMPHDKNGRPGAGSRHRASEAEATANPLLAGVEKGVSPSRSF